MKKKIVLSAVIVLIIAIFTIPVYFFIVDIESKAPENTIDGVEIETTEFMSRKVFTILPKNVDTKKTILYFHGGAYMAELTDNHWKFLQHLSKDTKSIIIVPDYHLAPKYTYKDVLKMSETVYTDTIKKVDSKNFIMMGDSAGGGLALGLEEFLSINNIELPSKTVLISPWLDTAMSNTKIEEVQPHDKALNKFKLYIAGFLYSRGIKENEKYFVSPLNGQLSKLKNITIYTGTYDILNPDCHLLQEKSQKAGVNIQLKEYQTAPHIWIINNDDNLAKQAYNDLLIEMGE